VIRRETADGVCVLTLAQPQRGNALSEAMVEALLERVEAAIADPAVHTLVLAGEGRNFCTGFDIGELPEAESASVAATDGPLLWRFVRIEQLLATLWQAPLRTVAVAQGRAWGAGADLFAACDLRLATGDTQWRFPGAGFGLVLGSGRLAEQVGAARAQDWVAHGRGIDGQTALDSGFVTALLPRAEDWREHLPPLAVDRSTYAALKAAMRPARPDADLAALVRSATRPGLARRIAAYRAASRPRS